MAQTTRSTIRVAGFSNPELDFQLLRQMGSAAYGGAAVGQCLALVERIDASVSGSWVQAFSALAESLERDAERRANKGHGISARDQYLLACNAYRAAEYYTPLDAPNHARLGIRSRQCLQKAVQNLPHSYEAFFVPHDGAGLPACFMSPEPGGKPRATLVAVSGYDGTIEETYFQIGRAALERGFNVCLFAGPGQMDSLRFAPGLVFEPDYERPVSALLDMLLSRPEVDASRLALYGISLGGYFAPRAAAFEPRIKALIANSPVVDMYAYMCAIAGFDPLQELSDEDDFGIADLPKIPDDIMSPLVKESSRTLMLRYGKSSFKAVFRRVREFSLQGLLGQIDCPCLALAGAGEGEEVLRQFQEFCHGVGAREKGWVKERLFSEAEGADSHCQLGHPALAAAEVLDWLAETLDQG